MKNTKKLVLSLVGMLAIVGLVIVSSNIVSAANWPIGRINNLTASRIVTKAIISFDTKNVGLAGIVWSKVYKQVGSSWVQIYSYQAYLNYGSSYHNSATATGLTPQVLYTFKVQVGHGSTVDDTKYIQK